jgi:hypothetical protein
MVIHRLSIEGHENVLKVAAFRCATSPLPLFMIILCLFALQHLQNYSHIFSIPSYLDNTVANGNYFDVRC